MMILIWGKLEIIMKDFVLPQEIIYSGCRQQENGLINGCHKKKYFSAGIKGLES